MLIALFKHELRQLAADHLLYGLAVLLAGVIAYGLWNGMRWVQFQEQAIAAAQEETTITLSRAKQRAEQILSGQEEARWWDSPADVRGFIWKYLASYAIKPPAPLAPLAVGQGDLYPYLLKVAPGVPPSVTTAYENANPRQLLLGPFDLAFVVIYLLPLFILALTYDVLAGEKESGILSLLAAQPVSLSRLMLGKIAFRWLFVLAIIGALLGGALWFTGFKFTAPSVGAQLLSWSGVVIAYTVFWFLLGMLIVSYGWKSATNALALAALWLVLVIVVPAGVNLWIRTAYPLPSRIDYIKTMRDANDQILADEAQIAERFFADHPELRPQENTEDVQRVTTRVLSGVELDRRLQAVEADFATQLERQQDLAERLKFLSPALLVHSAFLDLTGTGLARHRQFMAQVDTYHAKLKDYFNPKLIKGEFIFTGFDEFPRFQYREETASDLRPRIAADTLGLLVPALVMALIASITLRNYAGLNWLK